MKLKMALLEQAHGLLCNAPGTGHGARTDPEGVAEWERLRAQWIDQWAHVIRAQQAKEHNRRVAIGNEAIGDYQASEQAAERTAREVCSMLDEFGPDAEASVRPEAATRVRVHYDASRVLRWPDGTRVDRTVSIRCDAPDEYTASDTDFAARHDGT